jgi:hydroxymethylglutaryl-CoA reductase
MGLHARSLAVSVGAKGDEIDRISETMVSEGNISMARARDLLESIRKSSA